MTNEEKILELLGTMQEDLARVNDRLGRLEAAQDKMQAAQDKMQEDLDTVKTAQDKMQATQAQMQEDLDTVKSTQAQMQAKQDKMETDLTRVRTILEVDVDRDIRVLKNGHMGITEQLHKLDDIEKKLEDVSIRADSAHAAAVVNEYEITQLKQVR